MILTQRNTKTHHNHHNTHTLHKKRKTVNTKTDHGENSERVYAMKHWSCVCYECGENTRKYYTFRNQRLYMQYKNTEVTIKSNVHTEQYPEMAFYMLKWITLDILSKTK